MQVKDFLSEVFGYADGDVWTLIWKLKGKRSFWFRPTDTEAMLSCVREHGGGDLYYGIGLSPDNLGPKARCPNTRIAALTGIYLDVDILDAAHKATNLPPTEQEAAALLDSMCGLKPTFILHSGHGLQAGWLFHEPWLFDSPDAHELGGELLQRGWWAVAREAKAKGWKLDSVFDLARVLRLPDTTNTKNGANIQARLISWEPNLRYDPSELDDILPPIEEVPRESSITPTSEAITDTASGLTFDPEANPPVDKMFSMFDIEPRARAVWEGSIDTPDKTPSAMDWAMACHAVEFEWSDQEIVNLLIARRRKHGEELTPKKGLRPSYLTATALKARERRRQWLAEQGLQESSTIAGTPHETTDTKEAMRQAISAKLGFDVLGVVKYVEDPPTYLLRTTKADIELGGVDNLIVQHKLRSHIAGAIGHLIPTIKKEKNKPGTGWDAIAQALLDLCVIEQVSSESTHLGAIRQWVTEFLESRPPVKLDDIGISPNSPFACDGCYWLSSDGFLRWIHLFKSPLFAKQDLYRRLRRIGSSQKEFQVKLDNSKRSHRRGWSVPVELLPDGYSLDEIEDHAN
jgi:hypothetical protein